MLANSSTESFHEHYMDITTRHDAAYWEQVMAGQHFAVEDDLDEARFNRALWHGLLGEATPYPGARDEHD